jgi:DNA replication protein DnaC
MSDLHARLRTLGLISTGAALDDIIALATKKRWGPTETLEHVVALEEKDRARRGLERRMSRSRLEKFKPMSDFDWNWPTAIDRPLVESLLSLDFLESARNIVLVAPGGLGKTMIAQNIAHRTILSGRSVLFLSAAQLLLDLNAQESARALERRLHYYAKIGLLVMDELGFLAFDNRNADLLFQVVSRRYEKKSLVLTTNLAFADWHTIFPSATCATALVERVVHHADIVKIDGESYRLRESEADRHDPPRRPKTQEGTSRCLLTFNTPSSRKPGRTPAGRAAPIPPDRGARQHSQGYNRYAYAFNNSRWHLSTRAASDHAPVSSGGPGFPAEPLRDEARSSPAARWRGGLSGGHRSTFSKRALLQLRSTSAASAG